MRTLLFICTAIAVLFSTTPTLAQVEENQIPTLTKSFGLEGLRNFLAERKSSYEKVLAALSGTDRKEAEALFGGLAWVAELYQQKVGDLQELAKVESKIKVWEAKVKAGKPLMTGEIAQVNKFVSQMRTFQKEPRTNAVTRLRDGEKQCAGRLFCILPEFLESLPAQFSRKDGEIRAKAFDLLDRLQAFKGAPKA